MQKKKKIYTHGYALKKPKRITSESRTYQYCYDFYRCSIIITLQTKQIRHGYHNACLGIQFTEKGSTRIEMTSCLESNPNQRWEMPPRFDPKSWG